MVLLTLCNVDSRLFQRRTTTLYRRCTSLKIRRRIFIQFQSQINVISMLVHNVETMLKCWLGRFFRLKIVVIITQPQNWSCGNIKDIKFHYTNMFFKLHGNKIQNLRFCLSNIACWKFWWSEQICWELKVWMSNFLNIRSSHLDVYCKKEVLQSFGKFIGKYLFCSLCFNKISARSAVLLRRISSILLP